jgi:uncharacterized protein
MTAVQHEERKMLSDLEMLLKLQVIDYDLGELERSKEYIPDMMDNLRKEIQDTMEKYDNTAKELSDAKVSMKNMELEVKTKNEELKKLQGLMMSIKTNKEYDALISQIDAVKEYVSGRETAILELMQKIEEMESNIDDYKTKSEETKEQNEKQLAILQEKMDSVGSKIDLKQAERNNIIEKVSRRTMSVYERVRKNRGGDVVVPARKRACGACYKALPPHLIQEIKRGDRIITCDNCGRMLIWVNGESD